MRTAPCYRTPAAAPGRARAVYCARPWISGTSRSKERSASASPASPTVSDPASTRRSSSTRPTIPFLPDAQAGRAGAAFQAQLFFTLARHRQQTELRQSDLFSQLTVCDYLFDRDKIYAYLNLDDNELFIYQRLYELLAPDLPVPDLVIYLQTPTDLLRRRLRETAAGGPGDRPRSTTRTSGS